MSYSVWLEIDTGGPESYPIDPDLNYTSSVRPMWDLALKGTAIESVAEMHDRVAGDCVESLRIASRRMLLDYLDYEALNPADGWGNASGAREFLECMAYVCEAHPKAIVVVAR
jgi:hypothetical protein